MGGTPATHPAAPSVGTAAGPVAAPRGALSALLQHVTVMHRLGPLLAGLLELRPQPLELLLPEAARRVLDLPPPSRRSFSLLPPTHAGTLTELPPNTSPKHL